jgi:hypothetical protein
LHFRTDARCSRRSARQAQQENEPIKRYRPDPIRSDATFTRATTKSTTARLSALPQTSAIARSCALDPNIKSARVSVHSVRRICGRGLRIARRRPSTDFYSVPMSSRLTKNSLLGVPGLSPCWLCAVSAPSTRRPPTGAVISRALSLSSCALSMSSASAGNVNAFALAA